MKKLNKEYFEGKIDQLENYLDDDAMVGCMIRDNKAIPILHQIAHDGFIAGAEAQRVADKAAVRKLEIYTIKINENASGCGLLMGDVDAAIQSATVEFPDE